MKCSTEGCKREARMSVRTTRPTRADVRVTVYTDDRIAPKTASAHCKQCGTALLRELVDVLVDADEETA